MQINTNNILNNLQLNIAQIAQFQKENSQNIENESINSNKLDSTKADIMSYNDAIGYMQIASGTLNELSKQTETLNTLNKAVHNDSLNESQKEILKHQMKDIKETMSKMIENTKYNGENVFNHSFRLGNESISLEVSTDKLDINNQDSINKFDDFIHNTLRDISAFTLKANKHSEELLQKLVNETNLQKQQVELNPTNISQSHNIELLYQQLNNLL